MIARIRRCWLQTRPYVLPVTTILVAGATAYAAIVRDVVMRIP